MKVLIADDDIATIEMITNEIDWEEYDIQDILVAYNGERAKQIIERERPEIVICDIGMPRCNGVNVLKWVYEHDIQTEFIFLTCYSDFEYARDALSYNAFGYVTKPFELNELETTLSKAVKAAKKRLEVEDLAIIKQYWTEDQGFILQNMLEKLSVSREAISIEEIQNISNRLHLKINVTADYYMILISAQNRKIKTREKELGIRFREAVNQQILDNSQTGMLFSYRMGEHYAVLAFADSQKYSVELLQTSCRAFLRYCSEEWKIETNCIIADHTALDKIASNRKMLEHVFWENSDSMQKIIFCGDYRIRQEESSDVWLDNKSIREFLENQDKEGLLQFLYKEMKKKPVEKEEGRTMLHAVHQDLLQVFYSYLNGHNIQAHQIFRTIAEKQINDDAEASVENMADLAAFLYDCVISHVQAVEKPRTIVESAKQYIEEHYKSAEIGRNEIAEALFVSPNYLSGLFMKQTGMSLRSYINTFRVKEAQRLLEKTNLSVTQIATEVGFDNVSYFSTLFSRTCGKSPIGYRKKEEGLGR